MTLGAARQMVQSLVDMIDKWATDTGPMEIAIAIFLLRIRVAVAMDSWVAVAMDSWAANPAGNLIDLGIESLWVI